MKIKITLPGSVRSKKNSKRVCMIGGVNKPRRPMILPSKAYTVWEKKAREAAKKAYMGIPVACPVAVTVVAYYKGQRPDLSGVLESVGDCLEGIVWQDDQQILSWDGSRLEKDNTNPRTEVNVNFLHGGCHEIRG